MSRMVSLVALALATAAVVASVACADTGTHARTTADPLATSPLPEQSDVWTVGVGACSHLVKPAACLRQPTRANRMDGAAKVEAQSVGAAATTAGIVVLLGGVGVGLVSRRSRRDRMAPA